MSTIHLVTRIDAPIAVCFDMCRDIDLHCRTTARTKERAVAGVTTGKIGAGDFVTFEAVHFGVRQRLTGRITEFDPPHRFVDVMEKGAFKSLRHVHEFAESDGGTVMTDTMTFTCPFGPLGAMVDRLVLYRYMTRFLAERNQLFKEAVERSLDGASGRQ